MQPRTPLDPLEARVVGVLIEKELTTPEQYPLTLNALVAGANQKSNRAPEMSLSEGELRLVLDGLRPKGLVGVTNPSGGRVERYHHSAREVWGVGEAALALLAELLLRGPQTVGELRGRAARMAPIESIDAAGRELEALAVRGLVKRVDPEHGSRAPRWAQCLAPDAHPLAPPSAAASSAPRAPVSGLEARFAGLETEVARLRRQLDGLAAKFGEHLES
jgi:uncharacterized protein YceH (UPF0502 family)